MHDQFFFVYILIKGFKTKVKMIQINIKAVKRTRKKLKRKVKMQKKEEKKNRKEKIDIQSSSQQL